MTILERSRPACRHETRLAGGQDIRTRRATCAAFVAAVLLLVVIPANAATTTYNVSFSANSFQVGAGPDPAPEDPVTGEFTIDLDTNVAVSDETAGITLSSLNIALGSTLSYSYSPVMDGPFPAGTLRVGGLNEGSDVVTFSPSTSDFWFFINDVAGTPSFEQLGYTQSSVSSSNLFFTINQTGTVSVVEIAEPDLPGDGNGDGWVDGLDYLLWAGNFNTHPGADGDPDDGDYNDDGWVDGLDYLLWAGNFGTHVSTSVPEPSTCLLVMAGVATFVTSARRWRR